MKYSGNSLVRDPNMEPELRVATLKGNVPSLLELLAKDKLLLKNFTIKNRSETPLHIAAMLGHLEFVVEVLAQEPELAKKQDSYGSTPLHLAAAKGYFNIVVSLLTVNPDLCSICDNEQRNPLHVAAMKGHVDVLEFLVRVKPVVARDQVKNGQTVLHLCVKHDRLEALKLLIDIFNDDSFINTKDADGNTILHLVAIDDSFINTKDANGNTILHLAAIDALDGQSKTVDFLIDKGVDPKIKNSRGLTALGLLGQGEVNKQERKRKWQSSMHKTLMVVATLLATMAYQASITPPGGLWQEDPKVDANQTAPTPSAGEHYKAGESIMAIKKADDYKDFLICNTISLVASLSVIMLLISGLPLKRRRITTWIAMLIMWVAVTFMAATYAMSILTLTPDEDEWYTAETPVASAVITWVALMALIFLCHIILILWKFVPDVWKLDCKTSTRRMLRCADMA